MPTRILRAQVLQRIGAVRQGASTRVKLGGLGHFPDELSELTTPKKPGPQAHQIRIVPVSIGAPPALATLDLRGK